MVIDKMYSTAAIHTSSTPVQPPETVFHPTFMILVILVDFENDSRMYFLIVLLTDSAGAPGRVV